MKLFSLLNIEPKDYFKAWVLTIALVFSFLVFGYRFVVEELNRRVELVFDYEDVLMLKAYSGTQEEPIFRMLQKAGVTTICLPEDTLANLQRQGKATLISGEKLLNMSRLGQIQSYLLLNLIRTADIVPENYYVMIDQAKTFERAKNSLINELGDRARVVGSGIIEVKGQVDNLENIGLGLDDIKAAELAWYKFRIIPKLMNSKRLDDVSLGLKVDKIKDIPDVKTVLFAGNEVLGYGNKMSIVVEKMRNAGLNFGLIEFAAQKGERDLAQMLPGQTIGVHSAPAESLQKLDDGKIVDRYLLAASERGNRILYLHPFLNDRLSKDLLAYNEGYITKLQQNLTGRGFKLEPIDKMNVGINKYFSIVSALFISLGVAVSIYYFLGLFFRKVPGNILNSLLTIIPVAGIFAIPLGQFDEWRSVLAFIVAVIFPVYAMISQLPGGTDWHEKEHTNKDIFMIILKIVGITMIGIMLITGLLSDVYYMLKIYQFKGVKLAFVMPLVLVAFYYFLYPYRVNSLSFILRRFIQSQVTVGYVLVVVAVGMFFTLYLLRSGNYQLPVTSTEDFARRMLGYILFVRPRTKEFLIGWPLLVFTLRYLGNAIAYKYRWIFYTIATVAPISMLNTFCHFHAPLWVSILRSVNGLVLGLAIGFALVGIYKFANRIWKFIF